MDSAPLKPKRTPPAWIIARLLPKVSKPLTVATPIAVAIGGLMPVAFTVATGFVVSAVPAAVRSGSLGSPDGRKLLLALVTLASVFVAQQVLGPFRELLILTFARRVSLHLRSRVMAATLQPNGIAHLEDPEMLDRMSLARGVGAGEASPGDAARGLFGLMNEYVQWFGSAIVVGRYWWWLGAGLFVAQLVSRWVLRWELLRMFRVMVGETRAMRRSRYFRDLVLTPGAAKETRVFGMRAWIVKRFGQHWLEGMLDVWETRKRSRRAFAGLAVWLGAAYAGAFLVVAHAIGHTVHGHIVDAAAVTVLAGSIMNFSTFNMDSDLMLTQGAAAVPPALELEELLAARAQATDAGIAADGMPRRAIRFEGVTFTYPGNPNEVFSGLDLEIPAGRSLAIVGPNGAGKTTLAKLLARLYDPTHGRITIDDVDMRELDVVGWQRRLGAIFQDFVQYQLSAADNIGFGSIEHATDRAGIVDAAREAGAQSIIDALPKGWDTLLSRQFTGGADLSGGEWQRIALARALFAVRAGAGVLVLDEPTANLDVRAEAELFDRFLQLTRGLTTILISHRFSTVRRADHIVVLEHGRVTESGTHDELVALGGTYAHMFKLQAARFVEEMETP